MSAWGEFYSFLTAAQLSPDALYESLVAASTRFSGAVLESAPILLGACVAIRIIVGVSKEMLDGDLVDVISTTFYTLLMGGILSVILSVWQSGETYSIRTLAEKTLEGLSSATGQGGDPGGMNSVMSPFFNAAGDAIGRTFNVLVTIQNNLFSASTLLDTTISAIIDRDETALLGYLPNIGMLVVAWLAFLVAMIAVIGLLCAVLYYSLTGLFMIQVGLAFGPITIAAYPLIDSWAKKVLSTVAGGIAQFVAGLLLLGVLSEVVTRFTTMIGLVVGAIGAVGTP